MQRKKWCKPLWLSDRAKLPVIPADLSEKQWDPKLFQESKTRTEMRDGLPINDLMDVGMILVWLMLPFLFLV